MGLHRLLGRVQLLSAGADRLQLHGLLRDLGSAVCATAAALVAVATIASPFTAPLATPPLGPPPAPRAPITTAISRRQIVDKGMAYESNGSVYMDIGAFRAKGHKYPKLEPTKGKVRGVCDVDVTSM